MQIKIIVNNYFQKPLELGYIFVIFQTDGYLENCTLYLGSSGLLGSLARKYESLLIPPTLSTLKTEQCRECRFHEKIKVCRALSAVNGTNPEAVDGNKRPNPGARSYLRDWQ